MLSLMPTDNEFTQCRVYVQLDGIGSVV